MTRALGGGASKLERDWQCGRKKDFLLGGLGDLMKIYIVLGKLSYGIQRGRSPEQVQKLQMPQMTFTEFFGSVFVCSHTNYWYFRNLQHVINSLHRSLQYTYAHKFCNNFSHDVAFIDEAVGITASLGGVNFQQNSLILGFLDFVHRPEFCN
jgi:hypothetical protein